MAFMLLQLTSSQTTGRLSQPNRYRSHIRHTVIIHLTSILFQVLVFLCMSAVLINSSIEEATNCLLRVSFKAEQQLDYWSYKSVCHVTQVGQASSCSKQHSRWHSTNTASDEEHDEAGTGAVPRIISLWYSSRPHLRDPPETKPQNVSEYVTLQREISKCFPTHEAAFTPGAR